LPQRAPGAENTQARSNNVDGSGIQFAALNADDGADVLQVTRGAALGKGV
jgi:hypothetical protein